MSANLTLQRGYLLIVAVLLIAITGLFGATIAHMFIDKIKASTDTAASNQAFYIAMSGLEIAKRAILVKNVTCANIAATYTNISFPGGGSNIGAFTVTGTAGITANQLASAISNTATSIALTSTVGLTPIGIATIDSETIYYAGIVGSTLINVSRGFNGTTATTHLATDAVRQNICSLQSTGWVNTLATDHVSQIGKRVIRESIALGAPGSARSLLNKLPAAAVTCGNVVTATGSANFTNANTNNPGCAVMAHDSIALTNGASYQCQTASGYANGLQSNNAQISVDPTALYNIFFATPPNIGVLGQGGLEGSGYQAASATAINNIITSGKPGFGSNIVWYNNNLILGNGNNYLTTVPVAYPNTKILIVEGDLTIAGGVTIGSQANPVIIIVNNGGNLNMSNGCTVYGLVFVSGQTVMAGGAVLYGALVSVGAVNASNGIAVKFTTNVFNALSPPTIAPAPDIGEVFS